MAKTRPYYQDVDGFRLPGIFSADAYRTGLTYKPRPDDIFVSTFPKCGTTWTQMIVALIFDEGKPVADFVEFNARSPFLELCGIEGPEKMLRPGSIKVHLPFHLTPYSPDAKYIYVVRNPKDSLVSFFFHSRSNVYRYETGELKDYFELFINGETDFGDFFDNLLGWYEHRNDPNVLFITYEELKRDTRNMVKKIARFMGDKYGQRLEDEKVLADVLKYSSLEYMKGVFNDSFEAPTDDTKANDVDLSKAPAGLRHFMQKLAEYKPENNVSLKLIRKGQVGDWKNNLSEDQIRRFDTKIEAKLKGTEVYDYWKSIGCL